MKLIKHRTFALVIIFVSTAFSKNIILESLEIEAKSNGILLILNMDSIPDKNNISAWQANSGWFYMTLYKVKGDTNKLKPRNLQKGILDIQVIEGNESFQIGLRLNMPIEHYEFSNINNSNSIMASLHYSTEYLSQLDPMSSENKYIKIAGLPDGLKKWFYLTGTGVTLAGAVQENGERQKNIGVFILLSTFLIDQILKII